jgi:hypothetical protein
VVPSDNFLNSLEILYFILVLVIGIPAIIGFLGGIKRYFENNSQNGRIFAFICFIFATLAINASLMFGGGFYVGTIFADIGCCLILYTGLLYHQNKQQNLEHGKKPDYFTNIKSKKVITIGLCLAVLSSGVILMISGISETPNALIPEAKTIPKGIAPNHTNTFYIMPIWEGGGTEEQIMSQLQYIKQQVGGDAYTGEGFIKIGRSVSCWYTSDIYPNGSYNPTNLIKILSTCAATNTPILFHMNGGNWGQCCSDQPVIRAMRENVTNCQWDQTGYCHPIGFNPGPNDRFWSFWPGSEWEQFRERNIKQALAIMYDWWQDNPNLFVGFSTDSEIHLNYHTFEKENELRTGIRYKSYFDYNNGTIQQYREWAQANWTLTQFNEKCGTSFTSWAEVDAPRDANVVGKIGHPWWETWTDFRIWHVWQAGLRQCKWIADMGFPRDMIWNHQILSEPNDKDARYQRCDPLETAINPYCKVGVTRYGWISPEVWHSLGELALAETDDEIPSWGIFEWNLWEQHEYWAYREMLNSIYQYGGHVVCPNEWVNCSINEGLWIPGEPCNKSQVVTINGTKYGSSETGCAGTPGNCCCVQWDKNGTCLRCVDPHGNPQFLQALQDFIAIGQDYERGTCPELRIHKTKIWYSNYYAQTFNSFSDGTGTYIMAGVWLLCLIYVTIISIMGKKLKIKTDQTNT